MTVIFGYILGLPAFIVYYLTKKKRILADPLVRSKVGFLYVNYRPSSFLWEVQILAHKCFLTGALVCLYQYAIVQCTLAFIIAIMSHSMHALCFGKSWNVPGGHCVHAAFAPSGL